MNDILREHLINEELGYVTGGELGADGVYMYCRHCRDYKAYTDLIANDFFCPDCGNKLC